MFHEPPPNWLVPGDDDEVEDPIIAERDGLLRLLANIRQALYPYEGYIPDHEIGLFNYAGLSQAVHDAVLDLERLTMIVTEYNGPLHPPLDGPIGDPETHCWACLVFVDDNDITDPTWHETWCPWRLTKELASRGTIGRPPLHDDENDDE